VSDCASQLCEQQVCRARTATGNTCTADRFCETGSCRDGLCAELASAFGTCRYTSDCMPDLLCMSDGLCQTKGALENEACSDHPESCTRSMRCAAGVCSSFAGGRCCVPVLNAGETCAQNRDCADGLFCCVTDPGPSSAEDRVELMPCRPGQQGNTCVPAADVGEQCYVGQHCISGRCVAHHDQEPGVCAVALACD
jgi:hypothetical protein